MGFLACWIFSLFSFLVFDLDTSHLSKLSAASCWATWIGSGVSLAHAQLGRGEWNGNKNTCLGYLFLTDRGSED